MSLTSLPATCLGTLIAAALFAPVHPLCANPTSPQPPVTPTTGVTPLMRAAGDGNLAMVKSLLSSDAGINTKDSHGNMAILWAEMSGDPEASVAFERNIAHSMASSIIINSAEWGHPNVVQFLINRGANVTTKTLVRGQTTLVWAISHGYIQVANCLLDRSSSDVNVVDDDGDTPLMQAALTGDMALTQRLIRQHADIAGENNNGDDALEYAVMVGRTEIAKYLICHGVNVKAMTKTGLPIFYSAIHSGGTELAQMMLARGANVNERSKEGSTALMIAVTSARMVQFLLDHGADVNARTYPDKRFPTKYRDTALVCAINDLDMPKEDRLATIQILLDHGAKVNFLTQNGSTPLMCAVCEGEEDIVKLLIKYGADVNATESNVAGADTALKWATNYDQPELIPMLLAAGAKK